MHEHTIRLYKRQLPLQVSAHNEAHLSQSTMNETTTGNSVQSLDESVKNLERI
jgi:hypothetical protein